MHSAVGVGLEVAEDAVGLMLVTPVEEDLQEHAGARSMGDSS